MLADNETVDDSGEIVALQMEDTVEEESLECKSLGFMMRILKEPELCELWVVSMGSH